MRATSSGHTTLFGCLERREKGSRTKLLMALSSYTPVDGYAELKEAICEKFKRDNDLDYSPNQIVVST